MMPDLTYYQTSLLPADRLAAQDSAPIRVLYRPPTRNNITLLALEDKQRQIPIYVARFSVLLQEHVFEITRIAQRHNGSWLRWAKGFTFLSEADRDDFLSSLYEYSKQYWANLGNSTISLFGGDPRLIEQAVADVRSAFPDLPLTDDEVERILLAEANHPDRRLHRAHFGAFVALLACWQRSHYTLEATGMIWPTISVDRMADFARAKKGDPKVILLETFRKAIAQDEIVVTLDLRNIRQAYHLAYELELKDVIDLCLPALYLVQVGITTDPAVRVALYDLFSEKKPVNIVG